MLQQLLAALAIILTVANARGEQAAAAALPPLSPPRGLSPAFQHAVVGSEDKAARGDLKASPQDAPRTGVFSASPPVELRKSKTKVMHAIKEDSRMKFFSIPVGTKTPQEMKQPALRTDETMKFFSIPVGSRQHFGEKSEVCQ
uniref:Uncharacterized protein n=1 Tax=Hemiselmis andersenii TaxID=464988 RepID=A0A6T8PJE1_HEMAN|mmetsp:Transcript_40618/g.94977  ORF Transcript_40618/g.94977 Transcript_40618/m.94977 type:complete len:143 (+) Transcript_40618:446-874(+)